MVKKGDQTRASILDTARALFSEKGYAAVTMKDFCDRMGISRGGLYRHFASTKAIFISLLDLDKESAAAKLDQAIKAGIPARQIFQYFIREQKREIHQGGGLLSIAIYEFCISNPDQKPYLDRRYNAAVEILEKLIRYGQAQQVFIDCDSKETASHIVVFLEGLRLSSAVITLPDAAIDAQFQYIFSLVAKEEKATYHENIDRRG